MSPSDLASSDAAALRAELGHPIVDTDGHVVEFRPVMEEYLAEFAGARAVDRFRAMTFENPVELFATGNPDFFTGTVIEFEAEKVLQANS